MKIENFIIKCFIDSWEILYLKKIKSKIIAQKLLKVAATDMRYFAGWKFSRSLLVTTSSHQVRIVLSKQVGYLF